MGNFNRGNKFGGKKRFDNDRGFKRGGGSERPGMHRAVCAECGKDCEVPFRPSGDKPVFCSDCFGRKDSSSNSRPDRRESGRLSFDKPMFRAVCDKCGKDCEVPFRPSGDKPVFCSDCFGKGEKGTGGSSTSPSDQHKKQFEILNDKLDNILKILSSQVPVKTPPAIKSIVKDAKKPVIKNIEVKKVAASKKAAVPKKSVKKAVAKKKK